MEDGNPSGFYSGLFGSSQADDLPPPQYPIDDAFLNHLLGPIDFYPDIFPVPTSTAMPSTRAPSSIPNTIFRHPQQSSSMDTTPSFSTSHHSIDLGPSSSSLGFHPPPPPPQSQRPRVGQSATSAIPFFGEDRSSRLHERQAPRRRNAMVSFGDGQPPQGSIDPNLLRRNSVAVTPRWDAGIPKMSVDVSTIEGRRSSMPCALPSGSIGSFQGDRRRSSIPGFDSPIVPKMEEGAEAPSVPGQPYPLFSGAELQDFKHVLYNLVAEAHNHPGEENVVIPITVEDRGRTRHGFQFNMDVDPDRQLPELYALHIRKNHLEDEDPDSVFTQDLYRYYLRACQELMSKYFERAGKYSFLYEEVPLWEEGDTLEKAEYRLRNMKTRSRKRSKADISASIPNSIGKKRKKQADSG